MTTGLLARASDETHSFTKLLDFSGSIHRRTDTPASASSARQHATAALDLLLDSLPPHRCNSSAGAGARSNISTSMSHFGARLMHVLRVQFRHGLCGSGTPVKAREACIRSALARCRSKALGSNTCGGCVNCVRPGRRAEVRSRETSPSIPGSKVKPFGELGERPAPGRALAGCKIGLALGKRSF